MTEDLNAIRMENWELQTRVAELSVALESVRQEREDAMDNANSLHRELEKFRIEVRQLQAIVDRLRLHIQQGVEL